MTKIMTVRIEDDPNDEVNAIARADEVPVSEVIRAGLSHFAVRGSDPRFRDRLPKLLEKDTKGVGRLTAGG